MDSHITLLDDWRDLLQPTLGFKERYKAGKLMRQLCARESHGVWKPPQKRPNPIDLLEFQNQSQGRLQHLIPMRYGRMMQSPFAFFRGSALIMASDLAPSQRSDLLVQLCGDCHLSNFGISATPERNIIFDVNDFDETLPGPFEWDLKRLAASFVVAARNGGFSDAVGERCVRALSTTYRVDMDQFAQMNTLELWYQKVHWDDLVALIKSKGAKQLAIMSLSKLKEKRSHAGAFAKFTEVKDGVLRIRDDPPTIYHTDAATHDAIKQILMEYAHSLWKSRQCLLEKYRFVDIAAKVVGVGSVGTAAAVLLMQGPGNSEDFIFLQAKQANQSVLEKYLGYSEYEHCGERVVNGQRLLQSVADMFLGWATGPTKRQYYIRQLMDVKASVPVEQLDAQTLEQYAIVCAMALARGHARSGDPARLSGYLGKSECFDEALVKFSISYADQNERDYQLLLKAVIAGKIKVSEEGL
jgi:uncharacterized protein (DUF2252 family)